MIEAVRIVADYLNGTTSGAVSLSTALAAVARDSSDSAVTAPTIYDSTRNGFLARRIWPQDGSVTYPAVGVVLLGADYGLDAQPQPSDGGLRLEGACTVGVLCVVDLQDSDEALEDLGYIARGVLGSLTQMHRAALSKRSRNAVQLVRCNALRIETPPAEHEDKKATLAVVAQYQTIEATYS